MKMELHLEQHQIKAWIYGIILHAKAMQAMLVNRNEASYLQSMPKICYQWADAMMEARKK